MGDNQLIMDFLDSLKGQKELDGAPKCKINMTLGSRQSVITDTSIGECTFDVVYLSDMVVVTLKPTDLTDLTTMAGVIDSYIKISQAQLDAPEDEVNILCLTFAPNEDYWDTYVIMINPISWSYTAETPLEAADELRLLFRAQDVAYMEEGDEEAVQTGKDDFLF